MITRKQYLKTKPVCKVTFKLDKKEVNAKNSIHIVGEFNNWDTSSIMMKSLKNGSYTKTLDLAPGQEHQFRYLIDEKIWENDDYADKYVFSHMVIVIIRLLFSNKRGRLYADISSISQYSQRDFLS